MARTGPRSSNRSAFRLGIADRATLAVVDRSVFGRLGESRKAGPQQCSVKVARAAHSGDGQTIQGGDRERLLVGYARCSD